jgi:hypothetical protein
MRVPVTLQSPLAAFKALLQHRVRTDGSAVTHHRTAEPLLGFSASPGIYRVAGHAARRVPLSRLLTRLRATRTEARIDTLTSKCASAVFPAKPAA